MFQKEETACLKTCLRAKAWYFSGLGDMSIGASWRALCPGVRGHRGVKGWAEGKKNVGNRNQSIWGAWWGPGHMGLSKLHEELYLILRK